MMSTVQPVTMPSQVVNVTDQPWKIYARENDDFSCGKTFIKFISFFLFPPNIIRNKYKDGKIDGFYSSRWCNVFYRCFMAEKYEFLCAQQQDGTRTWWSQHSTDQQTPLASAYCEFPCVLKKKCTSPGGVLLDDQTPITESVSEADRVVENCDEFGTGPSVPLGRSHIDPLFESKISNSIICLKGNSDDDLFVLPEDGNECEGVTDKSMVPNSKYCNVFHVCLAGKRKDFRCAKASNRPYDLWWNNETKQCDWPCIVKCDKEIFDDTKDAAAIIELDKDHCDAPTVTHSTVLPGYGRK